MKKIGLLMLVFTIGVSVILAASPAAGSWDCKSSGDREFSFTLTFVEADGTLSGTMVSPRGERELSEVKCEDGVVTAKMETPNFTMNFKAEIDGDSLTGSMSNDRFERTFSGTRK